MVLYRFVNVGNVDVNYDASSVIEDDTVVGSIIEALQTQDPYLIGDDAINFIMSAPSDSPSVKPTVTCLIKQRW